MGIIEKVRKTITENELIKKGEKVLAAFSGGSDSAAMLYMLNILSSEMGFSLCAAHVNHSIRKEAADDEKFAADFCKRLGIECYTKKVNVLEYAKEKMISTELAGRELRYEFFDELSRKYSIDKIATAHNKNDSAESIMLHLTRGCGLDGMCGIPVMRDNRIIRPVIGVTKKEIEQFCSENNVEYTVDRTNFTDDYTRNKIRLNLIPLIERELNESFTKTVTENAQIFREAANFLDTYTKKVYNSVLIDGKIDVEKLMREDIAVVKNAVVMHFQSHTGKSEKLSLIHVNEIVKHMEKGDNHSTINISGGISAGIEYGYLFFENTKRENIQYEYEAVPNEKIYIAEAGIELVVREESNCGKNSKDRIYFYTDADCRFKVRNRRVGDKFMPCGMKGTKKVSDYFTDLKLPKSVRDIIPILTDGNDIIWIVGKRADRRFEKGSRLMSANILRRRNS